MDKLPLEVISYIVSYIDRPKDLLSLALTNQYLYALVVPDHLEYRHIFWLPSSPVKWQQLAGNLRLSCNIREFRITHHARQKKPVIPQRFQDGLDSCDLICWNDVWEALAKSRYLRLLSFSHFVDSGISELTNALALSGCHLEELHVSFSFPAQLMTNSFGTLLFLNKLSLLYMFEDSSMVSAPILRLLINIPNLTHFKLDLTCHHLLLWDIFSFQELYWPNLEALTISYRGPVQLHYSHHSLIHLPDLYGSVLPKFLERHRTIEYFAFDVSLLAKSFTPPSMDGLLPKLKSLRVELCCMLASFLFPVSFKALSHLTLSHPNLTAPNAMPFLETVVLLSRGGLSSLPSLAAAAPNIIKIYMELGRSFESVKEIISALRPLTKLTHLLGLLKRLDFEHGLGDAIADELYQIPSLTYIDSRKDVTYFCARIVRDNEKRVVEYQEVPRSVEDPDQWTRWGKFFEGVA